MRCTLRSLAVTLLMAALAWPALPATSQTASPASPSLRASVFNTKRELFGRVWGGGSWLAYSQDEDEKDLNGDKDADDTLVVLFDQRSKQLQPTNLAIDTAAVDDLDDWPIAFSAKGTLVALQVSEVDQGGMDYNGNGKAEDQVLFLYNTATRQATPLGVSGRYPTFAGDRLFFVQDEALARKDLNGDTDRGDAVLCSYDPATRQVESLGMEAAGGFKLAGDWIATQTSEAQQAGKDLNGDNDPSDVVIQVCQISQKKWTNTGLSTGAAMSGQTNYALTPRLVAVGVEEQAQGNKDLNNDGDTEDIVCQVWDLSGGKAFNTAQDCSEGLVADGITVGFISTEASQGNKDLNMDKDMEDAVVQCYVLGSDKVLNVGRDATGGIAAGAGKIAFVTSEEDHGKKDLNGDGDTDDFVIQVYDPVKNSVLNTRQAVDGELHVGEGTMAWKVLESDQFNRDLNRDNDTDDSILFAMDLSTGAFTSTGNACGDSVAVSAQGIGFSTFEADQGNRDLNMDGDSDDEILQVASLAK